MDKMRKIKNPKFENIKAYFALGHGTVSVGFFKSQQGDIERVGISFENLNNKYDIGKNITFETEPCKDEVIIHIDSLDSLRILQEQINRCKKYLEEKKQYTMKTYDKQKLNEYAKELFGLCLEKGIDIDTRSDGTIFIGINTDEDYLQFITNIDEDFWDYKHENMLPIWELIEKVKAL